MTNPCRLHLRPRTLASLLERVLGLSSLAGVYDQLPRDLNPFQFLDNTLDALGVSVELENPEILEDIPRDGPLLVVANHPLGGLEGMAIARIIGGIRPDLQVLTNELLRLIPELAPLFIGVNVLSRNAAAANLSGIRQIHRHLKQGGALQLFPAGMVSAWSFGQGRVQDRHWNRLAGQLLQKYQCSCLPIGVGGKNSVMFYAAGLIHPRLRTLLLPRQLANKQGYRLPLKLGKLIPARELRLLRSPVAITQYLRVVTDSLAPECHRSVKTVRQGTESIDAGSGPNPQLASTIDGLADCRLVQHDEFDVYWASYDRLGNIMGQIAIDREHAFRAVGEGTGLSRDSDNFDPHYRHLFLWDKQVQRIAGAYRVGLVEEIVANHGVMGLYTRSLYRYDRTFIRQLGSAIEMGRSFIHPDYQRRPLALNLLWRGIGQILVNNPKYHTLFGSVSISREYSDLARSLIADTLLTNYKAKDLVPLVRPITPHKVQNRVWTEDMLTELANIKMLGKLIGRCDPGKAVPVLLRHYLSLNGKLVCFNVHAGFNNSLEGLIVVDARKTEVKTLNRFLGAEGTAHFLANHNLKDSA